MNRLSGDQKGKEASSAPATGRAAGEPRVLIQRPVCAPDIPAVNASVPPSGESAIDSTNIFSGGGIAAEIGEETRGARLRKPIANTSAAAAATAASVQASFSRLFRRCATGAGRPACEPPSPIHCSCSLTSCADEKRIFPNILENRR